MTADEWVVRWPTLGFLVADWVEQHCTVPDGVDRGAPFVMHPWQLWATVNHYRVRADALPAFGRRRGSRVAPASAFVHRRSLVVGPQKIGKGPWSATLCGAEGVGPVVFAGLAGDDDGYVCADWGCGCGWEWPYEPGDPMGRPWPQAEIQILATSTDQTDNIYRPLQAMARDGALGEQVRVGEEFARLPNGGRIDPVSSSANSRLGNPITFAMQDETGLYTRANGMIRVAETMRRGVAGMGGRSVQTTNAWDPAEDSDAQRTAEAVAEDIFRFHREPPKHLSYTNKRERRRIHAIVYEGAEHVDLETIDAEAAELVEKDPAQAERFFGNRLVAGGSTWMDERSWKARSAPTVRVVEREKITLGFDGSLGTVKSRRKPDATVLGGCRVSDGHLFRLFLDEAQRPDPDGLWTWEPDRRRLLEVLDDTFERFDVVLAWCDPQHWQNDIGNWALRYGPHPAGHDRVLERWTNNDEWMARELERLHTAVLNGDITHDGDEDVTRHFLNAQRHVKRSATTDPDGRRERVLVSKKHRNSPEKIDSVPTYTLALAARAHVLDKGLHEAEATKVDRTLRIH